MSTFDEILTQVVEVLQRQGRVAYGALKRRFALDDAYLQDLKDELIEAQQVAVDEGGKVLVWKGSSAKEATGQGAAEPFPRQTLTTSLSSAEAERRQLTVMFCDLVGSTPLAEQLDPEDLRQVILTYQQTCAEQIRRFDGYLARYVGDGLLVYFGYPQAHEDDAQRAIRAGLGIVAALPQLNSQLLQAVGALQDSPLQVRIGIHTGLVVIGDMGGGGYRDPMAIVGETPNIAARVQGIAAPNTVLISEATARLVQGLFECQDCGPQALKGVSTPVPVYCVLGESAAQSRFDVAIGRGLTPLVGREEELGLLRRRWEQAKTGEGQVVQLSGEPGIGKSRLVQTLKEEAITEGATRIEFRCSPYYQNSAFYPIIEHLQRLLQFAPHEAPHARLTKLTERLARYRFPQADTFALLAALLSLPPPEGVPPLPLSPQKQKQKTQEALVAWLVEEAEQAAVFCAWEDLHWADPSTLEVLTLLLEQIPTVQILTVLTCRPGFRPPWRPYSHLTQLTLSRLGRQQVESMVEQVTGGKALPAEVLHQIVAKTDGVPLFVEELTKMVVESIGPVGSHGQAAVTLGIPSTLQDALMARLDRLAPVREIAQVGAVLGREFNYELLHVVSPLDEETLQQGLRQLVEAELIYQRGLPPQATYLFKHALVQDTAYQSLLKSRRQQLHQQIAQVLAEQFPETVETQPELLAYHYTEASLKEQAIPYWQQAGQRASQRSAHVEAISHLSRGLVLLKTLPDTPERAQQELTLQITLGSALMATKGWSAPEVDHPYTRARELCRRVGETPQLVPVLWGLNAFYGMKGDSRTATELAEQLMRLAQRLQDPPALLIAHRLQGVYLFFLGELTQARAHLEQVIALYDRQQHHALAFLYGGYDPGVHCLGYAAGTLWHLGYPDQALQRVHQALALAQDLSHPNSLVYALDWAAGVHWCRREGQAAQKQAEALIGLSTEQGFPYFLAEGTIWRGWALAEQGQAEEGIAQIRQGMETYRATGAAQRPEFFAFLAEAYGRAGQVEEGLSILAEPLSLIGRHGERYFYAAELYRLKGQLALQKLVVARGQLAEKSRADSAHHEVAVAEAGTVGGAYPMGEEEAEACFLKAIDIARRQSAKSLELRAVMSVSRLWQQQGKKDEAHRMLAEIYGWFTEGFDTKDLQEARTLLEELT
jgi:class 3 adenylate cyclase/predicted ATPase